MVYLFRSQTYNDLFAEAVQALGIAEELKPLCRLRKYNVPNDLQQDAYTGREEASLEKLSINPYNTLSIEWKESAEGEFETWDPNVMVVKLNLWRPDIEYLSEDVLQPVRYKVRKDLQVKEFVRVLSEMFGVSTDNLVIMKRNALFHMASVERINEAKNEDKTLSAVRVNEGVNLFIENAAQEYESSSLGLVAEGQTKWEIEFELERNRFTIKYNAPRITEEPKDAVVSHNDPSLQFGGTPEVKESDYCHKVKMDQRQSIGELRIKIAGELKVDPSRVILKRGGSYGMELKEDDVTLKNAHLFNLSSIYVELGKRSGLKERRVVVYFASLYHPEETSDYLVDNLFFELQEVASVPLSLEMTVLQAKEYLAGLLLEKCGLKYAAE